MKPLPDTSKGQALYKDAKRLIPGATQLFGKRQELYLPDRWPAYYSSAKGCRITDLDLNEYYDFTMCGIGTSVLGYADPDVEEAVIKAIRSGNMTTLNCPEEVALAELLCELHPWANQVRYARTGGEVMTLAIRIARAATGRDSIAFCGYHGWHDWYLAVNLNTDEEDPLKGHLLAGLEPAGVPKGLAKTAYPFSYNKIEELKAIAAQKGNQIAAIVMEPVRNDGPAEGFLQEVRKIADQIGAVLIFDEITSGWRMDTCGMHQIYGVAPDLATFAKTMSNGIPMAAVIGRGNVMDYAQRTFISSAYWTERSGPSAALATLNKHRRIQAGKTLTAIGQSVQDGWKKAAEENGLTIAVQGLPPISNFVFKHDDALVLQTLYTQEMLRRGFLANDRFYPTVAHDSQAVALYLEAVSETFQLIAKGIANGSPAALLEGPVKQSGFQRLN